jgi:hypothetical protein
LGVFHKYCVSWSEFGLELWVPGDVKPVSKARFYIRKDVGVLDKWSEAEHPGSSAARLGRMLTPPSSTAMLRCRFLALGCVFSDIEVDYRQTSSMESGNKVKACFE